MPDELSAILRRLDMNERNSTDLAKTVTVLVEDVSNLKLKDAVNAEREKARDDWRQRTEKKLDRIYGLGWWVLATFGASAIAGIVALVFLVFRRGLNVS